MTCSFCGVPSKFSEFCEECGDVTSACNNDKNMLLRGCFVCGNPWSLAKTQKLTLAFSATPPGIPQLNNLLSQAQANPNGSLASALSSTATCSQSQTPPAVHWVNSTNKLRHNVEICKNVVAHFGNGFASMRKIEAGLQATTGIQIKNGVAVPGSPNNALGELRLLVSNDRCEYRQIRVSFEDTENRHLLYRSTGGRVMEYVVNENGERMKQQKTASFASCTYVYVGAFSFCKEISQHTQTQWMLRHDGEYKRYMEVVGKAGEHFHHSEQSFFRLLYNYASTLPKFIYKGFANQQSDFIGGGSLTLHVLSIDIFTTRAACDNCANSSLVVLKSPDHFFARFASAATEKFKAASSFRNLVRIACAVRHNNTPADATSATMPAVPNGTVHALPDESAGNASDLDDLNLVHVRLQLPVNTAEFILQAGGDKRHWTLIEMHINQIKQLGNKIKSRHDIFGEIHKVLENVVQNEPETFLLITLELTKRLEGNKNIIEHDKALSKLDGSKPVDPVHQRVLQVLRCSVLGNVDKDEKNNKTLRIMLRHFKQFGFVSPAAAKEEIIRALNDARRSEFSGILPVTASQVAGFYFSVAERFDGVLQQVKADVEQEIRELCRSQDTGAKEDAAALAHDFELPEAYENAVQTNADPDLDVNSNNITSSSHQGGTSSNSNNGL